MRSLHVVPADWPLTDGQQVFLAHIETVGDVLLVDAAAVTNNQPNGAWVDIRAIDGSGFEGIDNRASRASQRDRESARVAERVLVEVAADAPDAREAVCFEQVGMLVTVQVLVDEREADAATETVTQALASVAADLDVRGTSVATDRREHVFDAEGRVLAADQPHWRALGMGNVYLASALRPVHEAMHEFLTERARRGDLLRHESAQRAADTRRSRGTQGGGRRPALSPRQQERVYDEDQSGKQTRKALAARYGISTQTLGKYLRAEQARRAAIIATANPDT